MLLKGQAIWNRSSFCIFYYDASAQQNNQLTRKRITQTKISKIFQSSIFYPICCCGCFVYLAGCCPSADAFCNLQKLPKLFECRLNEKNRRKVILCFSFFRNPKLEVVLNHRFGLLCNGQYCWFHMNANSGIPVHTGLWVKVFLS